MKWIVIKVVQDFEDNGDREKALDKRINEIKEQNKAIMKRNREIEQDREMYGWPLKFVHNV